MGLGYDLARRAETAASKKTSSSPPPQSVVSTSSAAPADPYMLTPATRGVVSNNREAWPPAFTNARGDTFLTATKFHGLDASGVGDRPNESI